jgi:arabinose-5-phosphate isomerase
MTSPRFQCISAAMSKTEKTQIDIAIARRVLQLEVDALRALAAGLDDQFPAAVEVIFNAKGRIICTGIGKSGHVARKIAATMASTGTQAMFVHATEASHGDLGMISADDVVLALSKSGETSELSDVIHYTRRFGIPLIAMTAKRDSALGSAGDVKLIIPDAAEACAETNAPTTSTTLMIALGDALAVALLERRGFSHGDFAALHPGGRLGKKLLRVENLMHSGENLPVVLATARMPDVIYEISKKGLGMTTVVDGEGRLAGILTDGDLRRLMQQRGAATIELVVGDCMNKTPQTLAPVELAGSALRIMEERKITSLVVTDGARKPLGVVHLHDLWTLELF